MSINPIVKKLIDNNCDYEYYPTTQKIVDVIVDKIIGSYSGIRDECNRILDIGCGKGDFFQKLEISIKRYNRGKGMEL